jgi:hypothetical protein
MEMEMGGSGSRGRCHASMVAWCWAGWSGSAVGRGRGRLMTCLILPPALRPLMSLSSRSGTAQQSSNFPPCIPWRAHHLASPSLPFTLPCLPLPRNHLRRDLLRMHTSCVRAQVHALARFLLCVQHRDRIGGVGLVGRWIGCAARAVAWQRAAGYFFLSRAG